MKKSGLLVAFVFGCFFVATTAGALEGKVADEFAYLSGQTRQAMELSPVKLEILVERCDRLLEQTEHLQKSEKKIMGKRIRRLRGLFLYVLESKRSTGGAARK